MAGRYPWRFHHGPAKRKLLRSLLLGSHESYVCGWGDEPAVDGHYRRLCPRRENNTEGLLGKQDIRASINRMGSVDVKRGIILDLPCVCRMFPEFINILLFINQLLKDVL